MLFQKFAIIIILYIISVLNSWSFNIYTFVAILLLTSLCIKSNNVKQAFLRSFIILYIYRLVIYVAQQ